MVYGYETVSQAETLRALRDAAQDAENAGEDVTAADILDPEDLAFLRDLGRRIL